LSPALRVGYLVAPKPLRERVERYKRLTDFHTPWPLQRALAAFIIGGHLERHIRRMRRHYGDKRAALAEGLSPVAHLAHLRGLDAGLHVFLELEPGLDAPTIVARALEHGVVVSTVETYYIGCPLRHGLLLGYGGLELGQIADGARVLVDAIAAEAGADRRHMRDRHGTMTR
jgi:GntR family transcriptional regulator / MocR family aminotransferase